MDLIQQAANIAAEEKAAADSAALEGQQNDNNGEANVQSAEQQEAIDATKVFEYFDKNEGDLYKLLSNKFGKEVKSLDDLKTVEVVKEEVPLPDDVKRYRDFKLETGGTFEDFVQAQKDWKAEPKENIVREYLRKSEGYEPELADEIFEAEYKISEDDLDNDARKKRINMEKTYKKAIDFFEGQKQKYSMPKPEIVAQREAESTQAEQRRLFSEGMLKAYDQVKEVKIGESVFKLPEDPKVREDLQSVEGIMRRFKKEDGSMDFEKLATKLRLVDNLETVVKVESDARLAKYIQDQEKKLTNHKPGQFPSDVNTDDIVAQARKAFGF
jgi:hypothetical protein